MSLRPQQVHWFEAEIPRDQSVYAMETLAQSGSVELEDRGYHLMPCIDADLLRSNLEQIEKLVGRHAEDLPPASENPEKILGKPEKIAESALTAIREWSSSLLDTKRQLKKLTLELESLQLFRECMEAIGDDMDGLSSFGHSTKLLYKHVFACPKGQMENIHLDNKVFENLYHGENHDFWLLVSMSDREAVLDGAAALLHCQAVNIPEWLPARHADQLADLNKQINGLATRVAGLRSTLDSLRTDPEISSYLSVTRLLRWYLTISIGQTPDHSACHLSGWTTARNPGELEENLAAAGINASLVFAPPRGDLKPPVSQDVGNWSRPFGLFVNMLGTPGRYEIDPTPLLAIIVPLLFGFMFPDLGHGMVLAVVGLLASRRYESAIILLPCGLAASGFGLLFGEVFGIHGLIPPVLGSPLEHPVQILKVTVLLGVCLMLTGLVFSGIEAWWRAEFGRWMLEEAPIFAMYLSGALGLVFEELWTVSFLGLLWYLAGAIRLCWNDDGRCLVSRIGRFIESCYQLFVATFSFLRVGAFALAHAGFSVVVFELVQYIDTPVLQVLAFVLGHSFIIVVEGLIVMIQTTRLVVFEFFMRFLHFEGRIYQPLKNPLPET